MRTLLLATALAFCACTTTPDDSGADGDVQTLDDASVSPDLLPPPACQPACTAPQKFCNASHHCVGCLADTDCPLDSMCDAKTGSCVPGCHDASHCGKPAGADGGAAAKACCDGMCVETDSDVDNCGGCAMACKAAHARATCALGKCGSGACDSGWADCNMNAADGCEANLHVDTKNCTACGTDCSLPHATAACADGCYVGACDFGYDDCNGDVKDGCETSVVADPKNCGACGQPCSAPPHAQAQCINAACQITMCVQGWSDCNNDSKDGCEAQTGSDAKNCGACGNACGGNLVCVNGGCTCQQCNVPNAKTKCVNLQCVFDSCLPAWADCDKNLNNGCEININTDAKNCGQCGVVCGQGLVCIGAACVMPPPNRRVFITSALYVGGKIGGLAGADMICQTTANGAGLGGMWKAWLSDSLGSPSTRFAQSPVPYVRLDGTKIANDWAGLTSGALLAPINMTETMGAPPVAMPNNFKGEQEVWSGTNANGTWANEEDCGNWTDASNGNKVMTEGNANSTSKTWSYAHQWNGSPCSWQRPLYCFEQ